MTTTEQKLEDAAIDAAISAAIEHQRLTNPEAARWPDDYEDDEVEYARARMRAAVASYLAAAPASPQATHRHIKRGTLYRLLGYGEMQTEWWRELFATSIGGDDWRSVDMRPVAIYQSVDDGSLWVRPREEFEDGRFEPIPPKTEA